LFRSFVDTPGCVGLRAREGRVVRERHALIEAEVGALRALTVITAMSAVVGEAASAMGMTTPPSERVAPSEV